jgi:hypothetical protein
MEANSKNLHDISAFIPHEFFLSRDSIPRSNQKKKSSEYSVKLVPAPGGTYGYEIYSGKKLVIRQMNIPGRSGVKGFERKSDAIKVANLVISKLSKGIMPPTVEQKELEKLHIQ